MPVWLLIGFSAWAGKGLFKYEFFSTHDGLHHLARSYDALITFSEGHFPMRWAGTLNVHCGVPIFNFFYPLIYYLAVFIHPLTRNVFDSLKIIDFSTFFVGTIFFYLWMKEEVGSKWAAFTGAVMYLYAPYRFLLVFVRGSPEFMAYAILPAVLYIYAKALRAESHRKFVFLSFVGAFSGALLAISHNFTVMFLMPIILVYLLIKIVRNYRKLGKKRAAVLLFSFLSIFGIAAFFIFPAVLEEKFTQIGIPRFLYSDHFPTLWQLFRSPWGYFYSAPGTELDGMSFQLGYAHWLALAVTGTYFLVSSLAAILKRKSITVYIRENSYVIFFFILSLGSIFIMLPVSMPIWERIKLLQAIQFPWRILGISVFVISALVPYVLAKIKIRPLFIALAILLCAVAYMGNRNHLLPQPVMDLEVPALRDFEKLHYHRYSTTTFDDDILAPSAAESCQYSTPVLTTEKSEDIEYKELSRGSTFGSVIFKKSSTEKWEKLILNVGYFPGNLEARLDGEENVPYKDCEGRACVDATRINTGTHLISWRIVQTPLEMIFNWVSILFIVLWMGVVFRALYPNIKMRRKSLVVIVVLSIYLFFRLCNLYHRIGFGWDQERDAVAVSQILHGDIKLIGPRVIGPQGFFLPPYFFYLLTPFYLLSMGSPYAMIYFLWTYFVGFFALTYFVFKKIFATLPAIVFLSLWAINPLAISADTISWNPVVLPLCFVTLLYLLYRINKRYSYRKLVLIGVVYGIGFSFHSQFILLLPLVFPFIYTKRISELLKAGFSLFLGLLLTFVPLIVFDIKNNFLNLHLLFGFTKGTGSRNFLAFSPVFDRFISQLTNIYDIKGIWIVYFAAAISLILFLVKVYFINKYIRKILAGFLAVFVLTPFIFALYGNRPSEYYLIYILPISFTVISLFLRYIYMRFKLGPVVLVVALLLLSLFWYPRSYQETKPNPLGLYFKERSVKFLDTLGKSGEKQFNISFDVPFSEDAGFRYLLGHVGVKVTPSAPLVEYVIPLSKRETTVSFGGIGLYIPEKLFKE